MKSVFRGMVYQTTYYVNSHNNSLEYYLDVPKPYIDHNTRFMKMEEFFRCDIDKPPFENNSMVWIDELNDEFHILHAIRSTKDYYVYDCDYIIRTEESLELKELAKKNLEKELTELTEWQNKVKEPKKNDSQRNWLQKFLDW